MTKDAKEDKHVKARKQRERNVKQFDLINACTIVDVVLNAGAPTQLKGSGSGATMPISSIKGPNMARKDQLGPKKP